MPEPVIVVGLSSDVNDPSSVIVSAMSVLLNNKTETFIEFVFCLPNIDEIGRDELNKALNSKTTKCRFLDYESEFEKLNTFTTDQVKNIPVECFSKLILLKDLICNVNSFYYINDSIIVNTDLSELKIDENLLLSVVVDSFSMENRTSVLKHLYDNPLFSKFVSDPLSHPYFNTGFMQINSKKCRDLKIWEQILHTFRNNYSMPFADQDIINAVFQNYAEYISYLPPEYNVFCSSSLNHSEGHINGYYKQEETIRAYKSPLIYHYAGPEKPWNYPVCQYFDVWWEYASKTPIYEDLIRLSSSKWSREVKLHINTLNRLKQCENELASRHISKPVSRSYNDVVHVVLTGDNAYVMPLSVVMTSILENIADNVMVYFHMFVSGFSEDDEDKICNLKYEYNCEIEFIDVNKYMGYFDGADASTFTNDHVSLACYYRLLIFKILPESIDSCFYVDGDMIVNFDLHTLCHRMKDCIASVVVESFAMENRTSILKHLYNLSEFHNFVSNPLQYPYFNAGFLQINLKMCREEKIWDQIMALFHKNSKLPFADQDMLNAILGQQYSSLLDYLPPEYNVFCASTINHDVGHKNGYYSQKQTIEAYKNPKIFHYAGPEKPWAYPICQYCEIWWNYAVKSPLYAEAMLISSGRWTREVKLHIDTLARLKNCEENKHTTVEKRISKFLLNDDKVNEIYKARVDEGYYTHSSKVLTAFRLLWIRLNKNRIINSQLHIQSYNYDDSLIKKAILKHDCISFDIYDTLVCRPFDDPLDLLRLIESKYACSGFFDERIKADMVARGKHPELQDITLDMIYEEMPENLREYKQIELDWEYKYTVCNPSVLDLFKFAINHRKRVVIVSDMYLPECLINSILNKCGYSGFDKLFLSSSTTKLKRTGDAFELMINYVGCNPNKILHIGDNYELDYINAKKKGIDAICIDKNSFALSNDKPNLSIFKDPKTDLSCSLLSGILSLRRNNDDNYWFNFGYNFAGPVVYSYVKWLDLAISSDDIHTIYFIARDGYLLEKAINLLFPNKYVTNYVYAPRRVSNICNLDLDLKFSYGDWTSEFADSIYQNYLPENLKNTLDWESLTLSDKNKVIQENYDHLVKESDIRKNEYCKYVSAISDESTIAMVDSTTTFFSSQKLIQGVLDKQRVIGYYWVINSHTYDDGEVALENQRSYMPDHENHIIDWDVMEFILTSPEPPVVDVSSDGTPVFKEVNDNDKLRIGVFKEIADGALRFVEDCISLGLCNIFEIPPQVIENYINSWIQSPSDLDREMFAPMKLPVRCEHDEYVQIFKPWYL